MANPRRRLITAAIIDEPHAGPASAGPASLRTGDTSGVSRHDDRPAADHPRGKGRRLRLHHAGLAIANLLAAPVFPRPTRVGTLTVFPTTFDRWLAVRMLRGGPSADRIRFWRTLCRPGTVALDVGANLGIFALAAASAVGPEGVAIAIEPEPSLAESIRRAGRHAGVDHLRVVEAAALDRDGRARLESTPGHGGDHHIAATQVERGTVVRSVRVDDLCAEHAPGVEVSAIKIDVQGAEAQVLAGTTETLERHPHAEVLIEFWPQGLRRFGTDPTDLVRRWRDLGFESLLLDARGHRVPVDGRFFEVARSWPRRHADLLLTRRPTRWTKFR